MEIGAASGVRESLRITVRTTPARLEISNATARLEVDSSTPRAETGYRGWHSSIAHLAQFSQSRGSKGIQRVVRGGRELSRIESGGNPVATQARRSLEGYWSDHSVELAFIPKSPPRIDVEFSPAEITYTPGSVEIAFVPATGLNIIA